MVTNRTINILKTPLTTIAIDGTTNGMWTSGGSFSISLSTTLTNNVIGLYVSANTAVITSVSSASITWSGTRRKQVVNGGGHIELWYGTAAGTLSGEIITINVGAITYAAAICFAVNGASITSNPSSFVDPNASLPASGSSGTPNGISTTKAATFVTYAIRGQGDGSLGAGWTTLGGNRGALYLGAGYKIFTSPQSSLSASDTMTNVNGWISDAIMTAGQ